MAAEGRNKRYARQRAERLRELEETTGVLRSGRRLSEEPPEIASSDLPLIPQLIATGEPDSDTTYVPPSEEPVSDTPLTVYDSDPPGFIESHNELYAAEKDIEEILRRNAATEELFLSLRRSPELCREVLATVHYETKGWCKLATKQANQYGYVRVTWGGYGGHDLIQAHVLALWAEGRYAKESAADRDGELFSEYGDDASHLCGHPNCINPEHLVWESHTLNLARRGCRVWVDLPRCGSCGVVPEKKLAICEHNQTENRRRCVKHCEGYVSQRDFEANGLA